jgi:hypothetical protein
MNETEHWDGFVSFTGFSWHISSEFISMVLCGFSGLFFLSTHNTLHFVTTAIRAIFGWLQFIR